MHFPVAEVSCRYFKSARYDDLITIQTKLAAVSRASLRFAYQITREADTMLLASGWTKHACVDDQGRIIRIKMDLVKALGTKVQSPDNVDSD
jgi:acyl-CoA thioester hydrolase